MKSTNHKTQLSVFECLGLITIIFLFAGCGDQNSNTYQPYVPSEALSLAIEQNNNPIELCKTAKDSFYLNLCKVKELHKDKDSVAIEGLLSTMETQILSLDYKPFEAQFHYWKAMSEPADSLKLLSLNNSVNVYNSIGGVVDKESVLSFTALSYLIERDQAIPLLEKVMQQYGDTTAIEFLRAKLKLADIYNKQLKFENAFEMRKDILQEVEKRKDTYPQDYVDALDAMAISYYDLQELDDAVTYSERAVGFAEQFDLDKFDPLVNLITFLKNNYKYKECEKRIQELLLVGDDDEIRFEYERSYAMLYYGKADDENCVKHMRKAIAISEHLDLQDDFWVDLRLYLLKSLMYLGRHGEAEKVIDEVSKNINIHDDGVVFSELNLVKFKVTELYHMKNMSYEDSDALKSTFRKVEEFLTSLDAYVSTIDSKNAITIYELCFSIFDLKFELLLRLHRLLPDEGFDILAFKENERIKASSIFLKKIMRGISDKERFGKLLKREIQLRKEIFDSEDHNLKQERNLVIDSIRSINALYYDLHYADSHVYYEKVKEYCKQNKVNIIEYFSGLGFYFGALINEEGVHVEEIGYEIHDSYSELLSLDVLNKPEKFDSLNQEIYGLIYQPFEKHLIGNKILIVSDGIVDCVSFDSFISTITNDYLLNHYEIDYCYGLKNLLLEEGNDELVRSDDLSILAYSYTDENTISSPSGSSLAEITGAYNECSNIVSIFGEKNVSMVTGENATIEHFYKHAPSKNIVHIAMHGKGKANSMRDNKLFFRSGNSDNDVEEYIESSSLSSFENDIDLMFLNACETNKAKRIINEGNMSIARGFAESGVSNIVTSSWEIHDMTSSELVTDFYKNLKNGLAPNNSLREAKRKFIVDNKETPQAHPVYWGGLSFYFN